jgi:polygalacturonase
MTSLKKRLSLLVIALCLLAGRLPAWPSGVEGQESTAQTKKSEAQEYDVRAFGAQGDGQTLDTAAINEAIEAAAGSGGGTVRFPAGNYLSFSIHLKSNIALYLEQGAIIVAADPKEVKGSYDLPEPNAWDMYQDFGHSHWQTA